MDWTGFDKVLIGGALLSFLVGGWSGLATAAVMFVVLDYITGVAAAIYEAKRGTGSGLDSTVGLIGLLKKTIMLTMPIAGHFADVALGTGSMTRDAFLYGIVLNELLSLIENWGRMGLPTIPFLVDIIAVLKKRTGSKEGGIGPDA